MNKGIIEIYIIGEIYGLKTRLDNNQYQLLKYIQDNSKYKITFFEGDQIVEIKKNINQNTILYIICCDPTWINDFKNIKIYDMWDLCCTCGYKCDGNNKNCGFQPIKKYINNYKYDYILYRFDTYITRQQLQNYKKFKFGYFIDKNIFQDYKLEKKYDILLYGNVNKLTYPFRNKLYNILKKCNKFNIKIIHYSSRLRKAKKLPFGKELSKLINQSWITLSTKLTHDALLQKYYEIAMSKSVICGDYPDLDEEQFLKNNMIVLEHKMTDQEIIDILDKSLKDKQKLIDLSNKCYNYFMNKYTYYNGVKYFDKIFDKINMKI